ncbi:MAG: hypothetical protein N2258_05240 [Brevinematales bacterium]|nr:hypothetical protein [Brevinematales bacterium]
MLKNLLFLVLLVGSISYAEPFNKVVASVGDFAITSYDVESMRKFMQVYSGNATNAKIEPFKELLYIYSLEQIVKDNKKIILPKDEIDKMIDKMTNLTKEDKTNQMLVERAKIVDQFPEELRLYLRKSQIIRTLLSVDTRLRDKANEKIDEKEITNFYNEHKSSLIEPPSIDIVLVVCEQPSAASLDELERFEKTLEEIAKRLQKSNDISDLLEKNKKFIKFEPYSGRTGLKSVYELFQAGYPEEMLAFALTTTPIPTAKGKLVVKPGFVLGPEKTKFKNSNKIIYFIFKLVDRKVGANVPLEKVRNLIEAQLKEQKIMDSVKGYILDKINRKELEIVIYDEKYKGEYNEFLRR